MTTKVIFNVDAKIKEKAMKIVKTQGLTISYCLAKTLEDIASGKKVFEVEEYNFPTEDPTKEDLKVIKRAEKEFKEGKFINTEDWFKEIGYKSKYTK